MSAVVKTLTPFINKEILCEALKAVACEYSIQGNTIITDRLDYYGRQKFELINGRFAFLHDSSAEVYPWVNINNKEYKNVSSFLQNVEKQYNEIYSKRLEQLRLEAEQKQKEIERKRLEEERLRLEQERRDFVEKQKQTIIAESKAEGWAIEEKVIKDKVKLVLVRSVY